MCRGRENSQDSIGGEDRLIWLTYTTNFDLKHKIKGSIKGLMDKDCSKTHVHTASELIVKVEVTKQFLDFKAIKFDVEYVVDMLRKNSANYVLGIENATVENIAKKLQLLFSKEFGRRVEIILKETGKYGVEARVE